MHIRNLLIEWSQDIFPSYTSVVWDINEVVAMFAQRRFDLFTSSELAHAHGKIFDRFLDANSDSFVSDNSLQSAMFDLFEACEVFLAQRSQSYR